MSLVRLIFPPKSGLSPFIYRCGEKETIAQLRSRTDAKCAALCFTLTDGTVLDMSTEEFIDVSHCARPANGVPFVDVFLVDPNVSSLLPPAPSGSASSNVGQSTSATSVSIPYSHPITQTTQIIPTTTPASTSSLPNISFTFSPTYSPSQTVTQTANPTQNQVGLSQNVAQTASPLIQQKASPKINQLSANVSAPSSSPNRVSGSGISSKLNSLYAKDGKLFGASGGGPRSGPRPLCKGDQTPIMFTKKSEDPATQEYCTFHLLFSL